MSFPIRVLLVQNEPERAWFENTDKRLAATLIEAGESRLAQ